MERTRKGNGIRLLLLSAAILFNGSNIIAQELPALNPIHPESNYKSISTPSFIIPKEMLVSPTSWDKKSHPLRNEIVNFTKRLKSGIRIKETGINRNAYLELIDKQVRCFMETQYPNGMIKDPVGNSTYATGGYTLAAIVLYNSGYNKDKCILESAIKAMDYSVNWMLESVRLMENAVYEKKKKPFTMVDFYSQPILMAFEQFKNTVPENKINEWKDKLKRFTPNGYNLYGTKSNNWPIVHIGGEYLRALFGLTDMSYVEWVLETQKHHFTPFGMFNEWGAPFAYDGFSRYFLTCMLHRGYHGKFYEFYRDMCWKGAWTAMFYQSPCGEMATGYRSAHHIWNEAELAVVFEIYAAHYARAGFMDIAGAFKRGAHLAVRSMQRWVRPDGSAYIVKNRFPIKDQPKAANPHSTYSLLAAGMMAVAYLYADENIIEKASPADAGGFVFHIPEFNMVIANANGNYCQYMTRGNQIHNPTGLIRAHLKNSNPQLGPSDGAVDSKSRYGIYSIGITPAFIQNDGTEIRLSEFPSTKEFRPRESQPAEGPQAQIKILEAKDNKVKFSAEYNWNNSYIKQIINIDKKGITVTDEWDSKIPGELRIYYPALIFDGLEKTKIEMSSNTLELYLREGGTKFEILEPKDAELQRSIKKMINFNGEIEPIFFDTNQNKAKYRISGIKK